jgi:hypothetical protein
MIQSGSNPASAHLDLIRWTTQLLYTRGAPNGARARQSINGHSRNR